MVTGCRGSFVSDAKKCRMLCEIAFRDRPIQMLLFVSRPRPRLPKASSDLGRAVCHHSHVPFFFHSAHRYSTAFITNQCCIYRI